MSIQDVIARIKARMPGRAGDDPNIEEVDFTAEGRVVRHSFLDKAYLSLVILLVASLSFGLGRLSSVGKSNPIRIEYDPELVENGGMKAGGNSTSAVNAIAPTAGSPSSISSGEVVASKNGSKYHYTYCPGAKQIKEENKLTFASSLIAEQAGYALAGNCRPR